MQYAAAAVEQGARTRPTKEADVRRGLRLRAKAENPGRGNHTDATQFGLAPRVDAPRGPAYDLPPSVCGSPAPGGGPDRPGDRPLAPRASPGRPPAAIPSVVDFSKHLQKAEEAMRRRNYDFAVEVYLQLLEIDPDLGEARAGLRQAYRKRSEAKQGGSKLLRAIGGAGPLAMAKTLRKAGRHDAAAKALETYLGGQPLDAEANLMLGMALEDGGHLRSALAVYEFLAEIAPKNPAGLKRA